MRCPLSSDTSRCVCAVHAHLFHACTTCRRPPTLQDQLEETFGALHVWLAAENGIFMRPPPTQFEPKPVRPVSRTCWHGTIDDANLGGSVLCGNTERHGSNIALSGHSWTELQDAAAKGLIASQLMRVAVLDESCAFAVVITPRSAGPRTWCCAWPSCCIGAAAAAVQPASASADAELHDHDPVQAQGWVPRWPGLQPRSRFSTALIVPITFAAAGLGAAGRHQEEGGGSSHRSHPNRPHSPLSVPAH